jgi:hypothetical protein
LLKNRPKEKSEKKEQAVQNEQLALLVSYEATV